MKRRILSRHFTKWLVSRCGGKTRAHGDSINPPVLGSSSNRLDVSSLIRAASYEAPSSSSFSILSKAVDRSRIKHRGPLSNMRFGGKCRLKPEAGATV